MDSTGKFKAEMTEHKWLPEEGGSFKNDWGTEL